MKFVSRSPVHFHAGSHYTHGTCSSLTDGLLLEDVLAVENVAWRPETVKFCANAIAKFWYFGKLLPDEDDGR